MIRRNNHLPRGFTSKEITGWCGLGTRIGNYIAFIALAQTVSGRFANAS